MRPIIFFSHVCRHPVHKMVSLALYIICVVASVSGSVLCAMWLWRRSVGKSLLSAKAPEPWSTPHCVGVDIGQHTTTAYSYYGGKLGEITSQRSTVGVSPFRRSFVVFNVECSISNIGRSYMSVLDALICAGSRTPMAPSGLVSSSTLTPVGALSVLIQEIATMESRKRGNNGTFLMAVAFPPYVPTHVVPMLYNACASTKVHRLMVFEHSAACMAAYVHDAMPSPPPQYVVLADFGHTGFTVHLMEIGAGGYSARVRKTIVRKDVGTGKLDEEIARQLTATRGAAMWQRVLEAAEELRRELGNAPHYLSNVYKSASSSKFPESVLQMDSSEFKTIVEPTSDVVYEVLKEVHTTIRDLGQRARNIPCALFGGGFSIRDVRHPFEKLFPTCIDLRHGVARGLAVLGAMHHGKFTGQKWDIRPLYPIMPTMCKVGNFLSMSPHFHSARFQTAPAAAFPSSPRNRKSGLPPPQPQQGKLGTSPRSPTSTQFSQISPPLSPKRKLSDNKGRDIKELNT